MAPNVYATIQINNEGTSFMELVTTLMTLQRCDPGAIVHLFVTRECKLALTVAPFRFDRLNIYIDISISEFLDQSDEELNQNGKVVDYYMTFFTYLEHVLENSQTGVTFFTPGCFFLQNVKPVSFEADIVSIVHSIEPFKLDCTLFYVRTINFLRAWRDHILSKAEEEYNNTINDVLIEKKNEYVKKKGENLPEDFESILMVSYRNYNLVNFIKKKFEMINEIASENVSENGKEFTWASYPEEMFFSPIYLFRNYNPMDYKSLSNIFEKQTELKKIIGELESKLTSNEEDSCEIEEKLKLVRNSLENIEKDERDLNTITYKDKTLAVIHLQQINQTKEMYIVSHRVFSLVSSASATNQFIILASTGSKLNMEQSYNKDFGSHRYERRFSDELLSIVSQYYTGFLNSSRSMHSDAILSNYVHVCPADSEQEISISDLHRNQHTWYHFQLSDYALEIYNKYNPNGYSYHLKCPERPALLYMHLSKLGDKEGHQEGHDVICTRERTINFHDPGSGLPITPRVQGDEAQEREYNSLYREHLDGMLESRFVRVRPSSIYGACHQISEAFACGAVPVVIGTSPILLEGLKYPIVEGEHYLYVKYEQDLDDVINRLGVGKESAMREAGRAYYKEHFTYSSYIKHMFYHLFQY